jgi:hypothetical protein
MSDLYFKNARSPRLQTTEESFASGMNYTDTPLADGYVHTLVNFDFLDDGQVVTPRKGLRATGLLRPIDPSILYDTKGHMRIHAAKECWTSDSQVQSQVIFGNPDLDKLAFGSDVYRGSLLVATADKTKGEKFNDEVTEYGELESNLANGNAYFKVPKEQYIHGMPIENSAINSQHIGTFGYNDSYFYFNGKQLCMTKHFSTKMEPLETQGKIEKIAVDESAGNEYITKLLADVYASGTPLECVVWYVNSSSAFSDLSVQSWTQNGTALSISLKASNPDLPLKGTVWVAHSPTLYYNAEARHDEEIQTFPISLHPLPVNQADDSFILPTLSVDNMNTVQEGFCFRKSDTPKDVYFIIKYTDNVTVSYNMVKLVESERNQGSHYEEYPIEPRKVTPFEAATLGYNMLSEDPYTFTCGSEATAFTDNGILPYTLEDKPLRNPQINKPFKLKFYYERPSSGNFKVVFRWREQTASDWTEIKSFELPKDGTDASGKAIPIEVPFVAPVEKFIIQYEVFKANATNADGTADTSLDVSPVDGYVDIPVAANAQNFDFTKEASVYRPFDDIMTYSLWTCRGLTYWKERILLWGVEEDNTVLFSSEIGDPSYFPYDNYADYFDEPIVHAMVYLEDLLVFTKTKLYSLTMTADGTSWTKKVIQNNLSIDEYETHLITQVKNMVFFKSGNYYYMIVPKLNTLTGELTIAPVYKQVQELLDNFSDSVAYIINEVYGYAMPIRLINVNGFLDFENIHMIYTFNTDRSGVGNTSLKINFDLKYNTIRRAWTIDIFESYELVTLYSQDFTQPGTFVSMLNLEGNLAFVLYNMSDKVKSESYFKPTLVTETFDQNAYIAYAQEFRNHQMLDTGYRAFNTDYNKRYREVQLKVLNEHMESLEFGTRFVVDDRVRNSHLCQSEEEVIDDMEAEAGVSLDDARVSHWILTRDMFEIENELWKARVKVSGKGLSPRLVLKSFNEKDFKLLSFSWVYRVMNSR